MRNPTSKYIYDRFVNIPTLLAICFMILLFFIWLIGSLGQNRLMEIRMRADEVTRAYTQRLKLAIDIREAATATIARARLQRAARDIGVRGPVYRVNLNASRVRLEKLLNEGDMIWSNNSATLPKAEIEAWRKLRKAAEAFLIFAEDETKTDEMKGKEAAEQTGSPVETTESRLKTALATPSPTPLPVTDGEEFFKRRTEFESIADELSTTIAAGLKQAQDEIEALQYKSAREVSLAKWGTLFLGLIVIALTSWLVRNYIGKTKQQERLKQEAQGRLRSVFDSLSDNIVVLSTQGEVIDVNQAFLKQFKLTGAELKLQDYRAALAHVPEVASFVDETMHASSPDHRQRERIEVKSNNGHPDSSLFDVSVSPLRVGDETEGRVVVLDDVTEEEKVLEELRRSRTLSAVGQITAQVAHEIYNPLGAVKLNLELLEMQATEDEDVKHTIGRLKRGVEHLSTIVMDLRYLTRSRDPERKPTDLNKLLDEVVELASDRLERSRICITRNYDLQAPQGNLDPQQLRKVFLNLLINAVEASPQNGEVELRTRFIPSNDAESLTNLNAPRGALVISVIDHGVGMTPETRRRLFEAFYTTKRNGTGLGMMITQEIVKKHGGKIEVESEKDKGTQIDVYLPV